MATNVNKISTMSRDVKEVYNRNENPYEYTFISAGGSMTVKPYDIVNMFMELNIEHPTITL